MAEQPVHSTAAIPLKERSGPLTMGLLWVTMVTAFPTLLIGFEWCKNGLTFGQVLLCTILSCLILLLYGVAASQLGAQTGLGYTALSRGVFGYGGSCPVTFNLIWIFTLFYSVTALLFADTLNGLFHLNLSTPLLAAGLAIIMSVNNFFGFKGIANFARYFAAPLLILWVGYTFSKAIGNSPHSIFYEPPHKSFGLAMTTVSTFVIGFAVYGNEKDYWRFAVPKPIYSLIPLAVALLIGQIIFPLTGWTVAKLTGITEFSAASAFMTNYSFGGNAWIAALVIGASYFAANDSGLFASIQACEAIKDLPHRVWVSIMAIISAIVAFLLSTSGAAKSLESIASLNSIIMPTPTVIMLAEWFLLTRIFKTKRISIQEIPQAGHLPNIRWPACVALLSGLTVGLITSGTIPGLDILHVGVCSLQAWLTALVIYVPLRIIEHKQMVAYQQTILERILARRFEQALARLPLEPAAAP